VSLVVFVDNVVALEMYRRLGFIVEGTMVDYGFKRGKYIDAHVMSRLRPARPSSAAARPPQSDGGAPCDGC
jgi:RimJ/RimL family protein N-acetyltransferase